MELIGITIAILALLWAIAQTWWTAKSYFLSKESVDSNRALQTYSIDTKIFGYSGIENVYLVLPSKRNGLIRFNLTFDVNNSGKQSIDDLEIGISCNEDIILGNYFKDPENYSLTNSSQFSSHTASTFGAIGNMTARLAESLHPNSGFSISIPLFVKESTFVKAKKRIKLQNGKKVDISYEFQYSYIIKVMVSAKDHPPEIHRISLCPVTNSYKDYKYLESIVSSDENYTIPIVNDHRFSPFLAFRIDSKQIKSINCDGFKHREVIDTPKPELWMSSEEGSKKISDQSSLTLSNLEYIWLSKQPFVKDGTVKVNRPSE